MWKGFCAILKTAPISVNNSSLWENWQDVEECQFSKISGMRNDKIRISLESICDKNASLKLFLGNSFLPEILRWMVVIERSYKMTDIFLNHLARSAKQKPLHENYVQETFAITRWSDWLLRTAPIVYTLLAITVRDISGQSEGLVTRAWPMSSLARAVTCVDSLQIETLKPKHCQTWAPGQLSPGPLPLEHYRVNSDYRLGRILSHTK